MPVTIDGTTGVTTPGATVGAITGILKATSGVVSQAVAGTDYLTSTSGGAITLATAQTASGTSVDFTGIPSWAKRITVMLNGVSTNGTSFVQIQLGSTSFSTSGYKSTASFSGSGIFYAQATSGFITDTSYATASLTRAGFYVFCLIGSNTWTGSGNIGGDAVGQVTFACAGNSPALSGTLDRIRITTVNGTDTFDAGTINISYE